jgi:hypothetical protein
LGTAERIWKASGWLSDWPWLGDAGAATVMPPSQAVCAALGVGATSTGAGATGPGATGATAGKLVVTTDHRSPRRVEVAAAVGPLILSSTACRHRCERSISWRSRASRAVALGRTAPTSAT